MFVEILHPVCILFLFFLFFRAVVRFAIGTFVKTYSYFCHSETSGVFGDSYSLTNLGDKSVTL